MVTWVDIRPIAELGAIWIYMQYLSQLHQRLNWCWAGQHNGHQASKANPDFIITVGVSGGAAHCSRSRLGSITYLWWACQFHPGFMEFICVILASLPPIKHSASVTVSFFAQWLKTLRVKAWTYVSMYVGNLLFRVSASYMMPMTPSGSLTLLRPFHCMR